MKKTRIFIDSNVLIAGLASDQGASFRLLKLIEQRIFDAYVCQLVLYESEKNIKKKLPESLPYFYYALKNLPLTIVKDSKKFDNKLAKHFSKKSDLIIFQTIQKLQPDYFLTLNRKHFHQKPVRQIAHFKIRTPAQFLNEWEGNRISDSSSQNFKNLLP